MEDFGFVFFVKFVSEFKLH